MISRIRILGLKTILSDSTVNDLLEVFDFYQSAMASLDNQSTHLAEALKEKNDVLSANAHLKVLLLARDTELAKLRPPKPIFKVGQVVIYILPNGKDQAFKIRHSKLSSDRHWLYANARLVNDINWVSEKCFRGLNSEELG